MRAAVGPWLFVVVLLGCAPARDIDERIAVEPGGQLEVDLDFGDGLRPDPGSLEVASHDVAEVRILAGATGWGRALDLRTPQPQRVDVYRVLERDRPHHGGARVGAKHPDDRVPGLSVPVHQLPERAHPVGRPPGQSKTPLQEQQRSGSEEHDQDDLHDPMTHRAHTVAARLGSCRSRRSCRSLARFAPRRHAWHDPVAHPSSIHPVVVDPSKEGEEGDRHE